MVRQGDFIVEMVEAESKMPFREHRRTSDGKIFVETEPDIEYFVHIQNVAEHEYKSGAACVSAKITVDGQGMGFKYSLSRDNRRSIYAGLWKREDGVATTTALKVFKPPQKQRANGSPVQGSSYVTGKIQVDITERIITGEYYDDNKLQSQSTSTNFKPCSTIEYFGEQEKKKLLRSKVGCTVLAEDKTRKRSISKYRYTSGKLLDTITLQYCSAVGLIEVGVLPRPASWGIIQRPHQSSPTLKRAATAVAAPLSKKIRVETIVTSQESVFIDLSEVPSDNEEV